MTKKRGGEEELYVPVQRNGGDGARGHGDVGALRGWHGLAHDQAPRPPARHECPQRERHAHHAHDDVGERQVDDVQVARRRPLAGHVLLAALPEHDEAHQHVGHEPNHEQHAVRDHDGQFRVQYQHFIAVQLIFEYHVQRVVHAEVEGTVVLVAAGFVVRCPVGSVPEAAGTSAPTAVHRGLDQRGHHRHEPVEVVVLVQFRRVEHGACGARSAVAFGRPLNRWWPSYRVSPPAIRTNKTALNNDPHISHTSSPNARNS